MTLVVISSLDRAEEIRRKSERHWSVAFAATAIVVVGCIALLAWRWM